VSGAHCGEEGFRQRKVELGGAGKGSGARAGGVITVLYSGEDCQGRRVEQTVVVLRQLREGEGEGELGGGVSYSEKNEYRLEERRRFFSDGGGGRGRVLSGRHGKRWEVYVLMV